MTTLRVTTSCATNCSGALLFVTLLVGGPILLLCLSGGIALVGAGLDESLNGAVWPTRGQVEALWADGPTLCVMQLAVPSIVQASVHVNVTASCTTLDQLGMVVPMCQARGRPESAQLECDADALHDMYVHLNVGAALLCIFSAGCICMIVALHVLPRSRVKGADEI